MAASSGLIPSFSLKSRSVHGGVAAALVRLHGGGAISRHRSSLTTSQRCGGASIVSPRCRAGLDEALLSTMFPPIGIPDLDADFTRERCSIVVIGLSGPSCIPVETREKLAIRAIEELCKLDDIEEVAVISTCSRLEIYVLALRGGGGGGSGGVSQQVTDWISKASGVPVSEIGNHGVVLYDKDAVEHLFKVTSGLDSLWLDDESQILEQAQQVFAGALGLGRLMPRLFRDASNVGSRVRSETSIANNEDRLMKARPIIDEEANRFEAWRNQSARPAAVKSLRESLEKIRIAWRDKRLSKVGGDITEEQRKSIEDSSWEWINKLWKEGHDRIESSIQQEEIEERA